MNERRVELEDGSGGARYLDPTDRSEVVRWLAGESPIVFSVPHAGTDCPPWLADRMTTSARALPDTDWEVDRLVDFATERGHGLLVARATRYLVDLNRPTDDHNLYPGQPTSGLCPVQQFDGRPIYRAGQEPDADEVRRRIEGWWRPFHETLEGELDRRREAHGFAILFDCHSIAAQVPRLFEGTLPALNLGTNHGTSCDPQLQFRIESAMERSGLSSVSNGRFVGGAITRGYGRPGEGIHALQIEMSWDAYRRAGLWDDDRAAILVAALEEMTEAMELWAATAG